MFRNRLCHRLSASNPKYRMFLDGLPAPLQRSRNLLVGRHCGQRRTRVWIYKHVTLRPMDLQRPGRYRGQHDISQIQEWRSHAKTSYEALIRHAFSLPASRCDNFANLFPNPPLLDISGMNRNPKDRRTAFCDRQDVVPINARRDAPLCTCAPNERTRSDFG